MIKRVKYLLPESIDKGGKGKVMVASSIQIPSKRYISALQVHRRALWPERCCR